MTRPLAALAVLLAASSCAHAGIHLDDADALKVGRKIWKNEANMSVERLTHWNDGEDFASLGIGHFIWYKAGARGPFEESFPGLVEPLRASSVPVPAWLQPGTPCPWKDKADFDAQFHSARTNELRDMLSSDRSISVQARYAADRAERSLPKVLAAAPASERPILQARYDAVAAAPNGVYALVDYVNFKGEGVSPTERYPSAAVPGTFEGWGLLQALELMPDSPPGQPAVEAFARAADAALTRRVANSPPERNESRWLDGWRKRLRTYAER